MQTAVPSSDDEGTTSSTKYRGVYRLSSGKWKAKLFLSGISIYLGTFEIEEDAARCIDKVTVQVHGSANCSTNFLVHPATAARWLDEKLPKQIEELLEAKNTLPNPQRNYSKHAKKQNRKKERETRKSVILTVNQGPAKGILAEVQGIVSGGGGDGGRGGSFYKEKEEEKEEEKPTSARPAHRRRKRVRYDEDDGAMFSDSLRSEGPSSASEGNLHLHGGRGGSQRRGGGGGGGGDGGGGGGKWSKRKVRFLQLAV